jgi:hypothetical protein
LPDQEGPGQARVGDSARPQRDQVPGAAALAGKSALLGYVPGGRSLGSFVLQTGGRYLFACDNGSAQIQVASLSELP